MKTHTIIVKEKDWPTSKHKTREWERRVDIVKWIHDYENKNYEIIIRIK